MTSAAPVHHRGRLERLGSTPTSRAVLTGLTVSMIGFVALLGAILLLAPLVLHVVGGRHLGGWDLEVSRSLADLRSDPLDGITDVASHAAGQYLVPIGTVIAAIALVAARQWRWAALVVIAFATEGALYLATSTVIERARPPVGQLDVLIHDDSYYSGHAAASVVIAGLVVLLVIERTTQREIRAAAWVGGALFVLLVGFSRVERGMHYPTDVMVGILVGLGCLVSARIAVRVAETRAQSTRE
jgi:undecaprenyl-diphosphatase